MVAGECAQEQACELVADRLAEPQDGRRWPVLDPVQPSAVLENEGQTTGLGRGGVHAPNIGRGPPPVDPSRE